MALTKKEADRLVQKIADYFGMTSEALVEQCMTDSLNPGICLTCKSVTEEIEADQREGFCDACGINRVQSVLVILSLI